MASQQNDIEELKVFISARESICGECGENLGSKAWIALAGEKGALCMACADLDHLIYIPTGDATLTRRAKKHSTLSAVVLRWSVSRKRFERQGLLVEKKGLEKAEEECLADNEVRERRKAREAVRDRRYFDEFSQRVRELFPGCPTGRELAIAEQACQKYSRRVGRMTSTRSLDESTVRMAVVAHIRHCETEYDKLLSRGADRVEARYVVEKDVTAVLENWEGQFH
jgi:hypothetical protein